MHLFYVLLRHTLRDFGAIILFNSHLIHLFFITIRHEYVLTKDLLKTQQRVRFCEVNIEMLIRYRLLCYSCD